MFAEVADIVQVPLQEEVVQKQLPAHTNTLKNLMTVTFAADADINPILPLLEVATKQTPVITVI